MSITPEETIKILEAKVECKKRETSGIDIDCNYRNCDECDLCYKQGTTGEQIEALSMAISALQEQDIPDINVGDMVSRQKAIDAMCWACGHDCDKSKFVYNAPQDEQVIMCPEHYALSTLPSAQPEYEAVKAEDFAKTMSENTLYGFMAWYGEALELMERQGFVICKKTL